MSTLEQRLEKRKNQIGLVGTMLRFTQPTEGRGLSEHITHDWKEVVISVRQGLDLAPDEQTRRYVEKVLPHYDTDDLIEIVAMDLLEHGCGHRERPAYSNLGCPHTVDKHDQVLDGVTRALKEKGKQGHEHYMANAFEDILDNINVRRNTRHAGQILFWNNEGLETDGKYSEFYEAFVRTNLRVWGEPADATLLKRFYTNSDPVKTAVREFTSYLKNHLQVRNLSRIYGKEKPFRKLFDSSSWRDLAYQFTRATADLLQEQQPERMCFGSGAGGNGTPNESQGNAGSGSDPGEDQGGAQNGMFDKELKLPQTQEEIAHGRYKAGQGPSSHADPLLQLDALYRRIAKAIPVTTATYTQASSLPISFFGRRNPKQDETIKMKRVKGVGFDEEGKLTLKVARHELTHPANYKTHPREFPKLRIALLDRSGSMASSPTNDGNIGDTSFIPWGDNSKYHYALKGIYGIDNFLRSQGISSYVQSEAVTFSSSTQRSGRNRIGSEAERRALLREPSGGTTLDPEVLKQALADKSFLISISDGDIYSWTSVRDRFREVVSQADYCHIQIGSRNTFTTDLENWGIPVSYVRGDDDLSNLLIDVTSNYYKERSFAR